MSLFGLGRNQCTFRPKKSPPSGSKWESPSSSPLVVLERLVIRSSCIGSFRSSCTGETSWREWLHIATKKISCWNFDYVLDPPWERWLCGKHFISKPMPLFWTELMGRNLQ
ncbi:unnamed protein product [Sphagnum troendelagicum]|uniref:Uncharacterized protein n=1 Tax=Sphagnum troendelagicum TaxID=128251 RepID=A0ABP0V0B8_9BRYO